MGRPKEGFTTFTVVAKVNGKIISKSGLAGWVFDAIGLFMSLVPNACWNDLLSVKDEYGTEHLTRNLKKGVVTCQS